MGYKTTLLYKEYVDEWNYYNFVDMWEFGGYSDGCYIDIKSKEEDEKTVARLTEEHLDELVKNYMELKKDREDNMIYRNWKYHNIEYYEI